MSSPAIASPLSPITPHLIVDGAAAAISFYEQAFGAEVMSRLDAPDEMVLNAQLRINGATVMINDAMGMGPKGPQALGGSPVTIHLLVADVDAAFARALAAGAKPFMLPADMFWGDRYGVVQDPYGHRWSLATPVKSLSEAEIIAAAQELMRQHPPTPPPPAPAEDATTLVLERRLAAPRAAVWRCWSEPALLLEWFCPKPWQVTEVELDLRPGGVFRTKMQGPNGEESDGQPGMVLLVDPGRRLIFTDALAGEYRPAGKPFMVAEITLRDAPEGGTLYRAVARHWTAEERDNHAKMGFHQGWGLAAEQLEALAQTVGLPHA